MKKFVTSFVVILTAVTLTVGFGQDNQTPQAPEKAAEVQAKPVEEEAGQLKGVDLDEARKALTEHEQAQMEECSEKLQAVLDEYKFGLYPTLTIAPPQAPGQSPVVVPQVRLIRVQ